MARKKAKKATAKRVSKTSAIREALKKNGSPKEVVRILKRQGIVVTAQYVSTIKANDKRRAESGAPARRPGRPVGSSKSTAKQRRSQSVPGEELLLKAIDLVKEIGPTEAKKLIAKAVTIVERVRD